MTPVKVPLTSTTLGEEEAQAAADVVRSGWLTQGETVLAFEREFAAAMGTAYAVAVANCTLGLEIAYAAVGVSPGDEVIVPSLTFVATANAARRLGANVVFADITSDDDLCVDPVDVARKVTARTRAVVAVHYGGYAADLTGVRTALDARGAQQVTVLEDAAHAPGARDSEGRPCGSIGRVGAFSLFSNKNLTTGEGGMLVTNDETLATQMRLLRAHGMTTSTWDRHRGHASRYDVTLVGTNARMDEIRAAIGRVQLRRLADANAARARVAALYRTGIAQRAELSSLAVPFAAHRGSPAYHLFVVLLPRGTERAAVMASLREAGVQSSVHYPPTHTFSAYKTPCVLPHTDAVADRLLTLPLGPAMTQADVDTVLDALAQSLTPMR